MVDEAPGRDQKAVTRPPQAIAQVVVFKGPDSKALVEWPDLAQRLSLHGQTQPDEHVGLEVLDPPTCEVLGKPLDLLERPAGGGGLLEVPAAVGHRSGGRQRALAKQRANEFDEPSPRQDGVVVEKHEDLALGAGDAFVARGGKALVLFAANALEGGTLWHVESWAGSVLHDDDLVEQILGRFKGGQALLEDGRSAAGGDDEGDRRPRDGRSGLGCTPGCGEALQVRGLERLRHGNADSGLVGVWMGRVKIAQQPVLVPREPDALPPAGHEFASVAPGRDFPGDALVVSHIRKVVDDPVVGEEEEGSRRVVVAQAGVLDGVQPDKDQRGEALSGADHVFGRLPVRVPLDVHRVR